MNDNEIVANSGNIVHQLELTAREQWTIVAKESGKYVFLGLIWLLSMIVSSDWIAPKDMLLYFIGTLVFSVSGVGAFYKYKLGNKDKVYRSDTIGMAQTQTRIVDMFTEKLDRLEKGFNKRLSVLENRADFALIEFNKDTGEILRINKKFREWFGLSLEQLRGMTHGFDLKQTRNFMLNVLGQPEDRDKLKLDMNKGSGEFDNTNVYLMRKDGTAFPTKIEAVEVGFNGHTVIQHFIYDRQDEKDKDAVITAYRSLNAQMVRDFLAYNNRRASLRHMLKKVKNCGR